MTSDEAIGELCRYFLGDDFYVADPVGSSQMNEIIVDEIKRHYKTKVRVRKFKRDDGTLYVMITV